LSIGGRRLFDRSLDPGDDCKSLADLRIGHKALLVSLSYWLSARLADLQRHPEGAPERTRPRSLSLSGNDIYFLYIGISF
jgi:hypothetical protein